MCGRQIRLVFAATHRLQSEVVVQFPFMHEWVSSTEVSCVSGHSQPRQRLRHVTEHLVTLFDASVKRFTIQTRRDEFSNSFVGVIRRFGKAGSIALGNTVSHLGSSTPGSGQNAETVFCCGGSGDSHLGPEGPHVCVRTRHTFDQLIS